MHFLRFQEYYESASPQFRGKQFEIFDFMKWYSKKYGGGVFTYPMDWGGFNIPCEVILDVFPEIPDLNKYDKAMWEGYQQCQELAGSKEARFYIIGAIGKGETLKHEIAHGFFYTTPEYKKEMTKLVQALDPELRKQANSVLSKMGYTSKVYVDEIQAYMSTGLLDEFDPKLKKLRKPFIEVYRKYYDK